MDVLYASAARIAARGASKNPAIRAGIFGMAATAGLPGSWGPALAAKQIATINYLSGEGNRGQYRVGVVPGGTVSLLGGESRIRLIPNGLCDALDLGGAEGIGAVHERNADVDFCSLAVVVS